MRLALYREAGARLVVDVLRDETETRDGVKWYVAELRLVRVVRMGALRPMEPGHQWSVEAREDGAAYVGWFIDYNSQGE